jgi:hypothetical protein
MRLISTTIRKAGPAVRLECDAVLAGIPASMYFSVAEADAELLAGGAEAFVAAMLVPAMTTGGTLEVEPAVSRELLSGLARVQDVWRAWHGDRMHAVEVRASSRETPVATGPAACMFSGGIDSLYTLLRHPDESPVLLFGRGVSSPLSPQTMDKVDRDARRVAATAAELGLRLVTYETDVRTHFPLPWGELYHGAVLAASAHALSGGLAKVSIPSTHSYLEFRPWGSHPLLDEHYSTPAVRIIHDGSDATRAEKTAWLALHHREVLRHLHVCIGPDRDGTRNCGRCGKCVRTMVALAAVGMLDAAPTLPQRLPTDLEDILAGESPALTLANLELARRHAVDATLVRQLERAVRRRRRKDAARALAENTAFRHILPAIRHLRARGRMRAPAG